MNIHVAGLRTRAFSSGPHRASHARLNVFTTGLGFASVGIVSFFIHSRIGTLSTEPKSVLRSDSSDGYDGAPHDVLVVDRKQSQKSEEQGSGDATRERGIDVKRTSLSWMHMPKMPDMPKMSDLPKMPDIPKMPDWNEVSERIKNAVVPKWAQTLPGYIEKLQNELSLKPGTLADEMWQDAHDPELHPEILREAVVRISTDLCYEEQQFLDKRKIHTRKALAKYLGLRESEIHPDDVPTIAMCGSGGGLRALVAGTSSYYSAQQAGLFDCVTYTAGVSGSCWLQALYYSTVGGQNHSKLLQHLKNRLHVHIAFPPPLLTMLTSAPTSKFLLSGGFEKYRRVKDADFGLVDVYGLLLGARLLVPKGDLGVNNLDLKISHQRRHISDGQNPLPIYTAVRHEIPIQEQKDKGIDTEEAIAVARKEAWFQWFEFTPFEFWCEEWEAGIPVWAVGREFRNGRNIWRENGLSLPELRLPLLMGIFGSAFCATLSHYYKEIRPILHGLTGFSDLDQAISERDDELVKVHPIEPAQVPNFALGMKDLLPSSCPESVHSSPSIQLMDAGMSNNLPIYPLLRPGRNVDILIAFDASADVKQDNWLRVADGYAKKRGIKGWPLGSGWATQEAKGATATTTGKALTAAENATAAAAIAHAADKTQLHHDSPTLAAELGPCTIWVGSTTTTTHPSSPPPPPITHYTSPTTALTHPAAGLAVIYFPLLPNPSAPGIDPMTSDFMSTWNFVYTPDQVDAVVRLAAANFEEGKEMTRMCVRAVWERKKAERVRREEERVRYVDQLGGD